MAAGLADSERAGQEAEPPITAGPGSVEPLREGLFQAGFFPSEAAASGATPPGGEGLRSEGSVDGIRGGVEDDPSGSPRTTWDQGWRAARPARGEGDEGEASVDAAVEAAMAGGGAMAMSDEERATEFSEEEEEREREDRPLSPRAVACPRCWWPALCLSLTLFVCFT